MEKIFSLKSIKFMSSMVVLFALVFSLTLAGTVNKVEAADEPTAQTSKRTLSVSGQGVVKVSPDIAYITLGVITEHQNAKTAQQNNASAMDKVVAAIKSAGLANDDIKTVDYSINPKYTYNKDTGESKINGYTVTNSIQVTVKDIKKCGSIVDLASANGANSSGSISFGLSDYDRYYEQALKKAVENAKKRAQAMVEPFGLKIGIPVSIQENGSYNPPVIGIKRYEYDSAVSMSKSVATPVSEGTLEVTAGVSLSYEY